MAAVPGERKLITQTFMTAPCPACLERIQLTVQAYFPLPEEDLETLKKGLRKKLDARYDAHFASHADEISDADLCDECEAHNGGHPRCDSYECICTCQL